MCIRYLVQFSEFIVIKSLVIYFTYLLKSFKGFKAIKSFRQLLARNLADLWRWRSRTLLKDMQPSKSIDTCTVLGHCVLSVQPGWSPAQNFSKFIPAYTCRMFLKLTRPFLKMYAEIDLSNQQLWPLPCSKYRPKESVSSHSSCWDFSKKYHKIKKSNNWGIKCSWLIKKTKLIMWSDIWIYYVWISVW